MSISSIQRLFGQGPVRVAQHVEILRSPFMSTYYADGGVPVIEAAGGLEAVADNAVTTLSIPEGAIAISIKPKGAALRFFMTCLVPEQGADSTVEPVDPADPIADAFTDNFHYVDDGERMEFSIAGFNKIHFLTHEADAACELFYSFLA